MQPHVIAVCVVAFCASALTLFSGFGLGTLLLPALLFFFPAELAVAATAVVHLLNNLFKLALVGRHADRGIVLRFGLPAVAAAAAGSAVLAALSGGEPLLVYTFLSLRGSVTPVKLVMGLLIVGFAALEAVPALKDLRVREGKFVVGGLLSGFFGGLSGHQGALRSAFLIRAGLTKEAFVGTGVVVACMVDLTRLGAYAGHLNLAGVGEHLPLVVAASLSAFAGAFLGSRFLHAATPRGMRTLVAVLLVAVGAGVAAGIL